MRSSPPSSSGIVSLIAVGRWWWARGIASDVVGLKEDRKSISKETTFDEDVSEAEALRDTLLWLASEVGHIARHEALSGTVITLKIRLEGFETHTRRQTLDAPTNRDRVIFQTAWALYHHSGYCGRPVRLIGIGLSGWGGGQGAQLDLFAPRQAGEREERLYATIDQIRARFGKETLRPGLPTKKVVH